MADLAIGISKTVVEALAKKVNAAIKGEAELWQIVQRDTVFMKDEFEIMQAFLKTVDWEQSNNNVVKTWVRQIRHLYSDAEDTIESILLLDTKRSFWTMLHHLVASSNCISGAAPSPLEQAVAKIQVFKARVEEISNRSVRYNLINDSRFMPIPSEQLVLGHAIGTTAAVDIRSEAWSTTHKQGGFVDLTMLVNESSDDLRIISLWGTQGDFGVTSIIKEAYEREEIRQKFRNRAWLKLSHPFNSQEFIQRLAEQFYCKDEGEIITVVAKRVKEQRYLVILEGLSSMSEWQAVRTWLPADSKNGSRIVVSTNQLEIARLCAGKSYQVSELRKLPNSHSIFAFFCEGFKRVEGGTVYSGSSLAQLAESIVLAGRRSDEKELSELISSASRGEKSPVISVWGFPGVGKSSLVKAVLSRQEMEHTFKFKWYIDMSYPFNLSVLCRRILSDTWLEMQEVAVNIVSESIDEKIIIQKYAKLLQDHRCLLAIGGLRLKEDWNSIKQLMPEHSQTSIILVVTAEKAVAKYCARHDDAVYRVKALEPDNAYKLFDQNCEGARTLRDDARMHKEAKNILAKCGGIPAVIIAVARCLGTQEGNIRQRKLCHLKDNFIHELETNPEFDSLRVLFAWMHFNIDALPRSSLQCYLYGSVFSEMKNIPRSHFMRRWIAEGYIQSADGNTMEEDAAELFSRFVKQTELLGGWGGNSFFHEYINSRLMEDKLIFRPHVSVLSKMGQSLTVEGRGQHLAIRSCWVRFESAFNNLDLTELQSLTVSGQWMAFFMPCQMKWLRVLDLEGAACVDDEELKRILELVPRLRFLSLRGHKGITHLPDSLYRLVYLQTLDIRDTSVVYVELHKLRNLQWFRAGTGVSRTGIHPGLGPEEHSMPSVSSSRSRAARLLGVGGTIRPCYGVKVPRGIRHLKALDTLGVINVNTTDGTGILDELRLLKHLKKLQVSGINRKNSKFLSRTIINQKNLESLSLQFEEEDRAVREGDISPPPSIRSLKLHGHVEKLSALRFNNLRNIRKLSLQMTNLLRQQDVDLIGRVRSLITLSLLIDSSQDGQLQFPPHLFCKLKVLEIVCMSKLRVIFDQGAMEKLEVLKAHCCSDSSLKVTGLEHPVSLKQVCLQGSYGHTLKEALQEQLASHPKKPALNLQMNEDWD